MKKLTLLFLVLATAVACQKEKETDFEKGKKAGQSFCACVEKASPETQMLCMLSLDMNKITAQTASGNQLTDYVAGLMTAPCMFDLINEGVFTESEDY
ncbi:hypothetical protein FACS189452_04370 [Bacteroidia bacterium]|nr:hypothetical protein FACS189452_04370 [Bacteroidia bacterium]GHT81211.1 hypothetical protein FACS189467_4860 [Bacteroidia bacterium]